jgi:uncharacterized protein YidB (DUF937 family)
MGLLDGLVGQLAREAAGQALQKQGGLGGVLGSLVKNMGQHEQPTTPSHPTSSSQVDSPFNLPTDGQSSATGGGLGGVLGSVLGGLTGGNVAPQGTNQLMVILLPMILAWVQRQGGIGAVFESLQKNGLAAQAQSWMSTSGNQQISPEQMNQLFGSSEINQMASQAGVSQEAVLSGLSNLMPQVIDQLTPTGDLSQADQANNEVSSLLASLQSALS